MRVWFVWCKCPKPVVNCRNGDVIKFITTLLESQSLCVTLLSSEVRQSLSTAQSHYSQWCMLLDSDVDIDKIQGVASELRNCIKSIDWDLEDLEQTISILFHVIHPYIAPLCCQVKTHP